VSLFRCIILERIKWIRWYDEIDNRVGISMLNYGYDASNMAYTVEHRGGIIHQIWRMKKLVVVFSKRGKDVAFHNFIDLLI